MLAVASLLTTLTLSLTGLSREAAQFQARSAFTTSESEAVVNHPVRRRIAMLLMLAGGAGIITTLATVLLSFSRIEASASR